jgi:kumamolisin
MEQIDRDERSSSYSSSADSSHLRSRVLHGSALIITRILAIAAFAAICATWSYAAGAASPRPDEAAAQARAKATGMPAEAGALDPSVRLTIEVVLSLRNVDELNALMGHITNPNDPLHGKYLSPDQFANHYGPVKEDVDAIADFLTASGLKLESKKTVEGLVRVSGTVADMQRIFDIKMKRYAAPSGRIYYSASTTPVVPAAIAPKVVAVLGLCDGAEVHNDLSVEYPSLGLSDANTVYYSGFTGLSPQDIWSIYKMGGIGSTTTGAGETLGLYEEEGYSTSDLQTYFGYYFEQHHPGWPFPNVVPISVDDFPISPQEVSLECTLDLDMYMALAPQATTDEVFENTSDVSSWADYLSEFIDTFKSMATINTTQGLPLPNVISVSYSVSENWFQTSWNPEGPADAAAENQALMQLAAQGQSVCASSGDGGAWGDQSEYPTELPNVEDPGSEPYVTGVGGTNLTDTSSSPHEYVSETSWFTAPAPGNKSFGQGGGGGISQVWPIPYWQVGTFSPAVNPQGSLTMRNDPDVSLYADDDPGYDVYCEGRWIGVGGTSASSPLWAALLADADEVRATKGIGPIGLANPILYSIAEDPYYGGDFNDIADGSTNGYYTTVPGYDNSTGWGSYNGANLLNQLSLHDSYTTVTSTAEPAVSGQPLTFTATVSSSDGGNPVNGLVVFDGVVPGTSIGVNMSGNKATCNGSFTSPGSYTITAWYNGDANDLISVGNFNQVVALKNTTTVVSASPFGGALGSPVTLTATVSAVAPGTGTPTGSIVFDTVSTNGSLIPLGTVTLSSGIASFTTSKLPEGANPIEAVYSGDSTSSASSGACIAQVDS